MAACLRRPDACAGCRTCPDLADCSRRHGARLAGVNLVASRRTAAALDSELSRGGRLSRCFPHLSPVFRQGSGHRAAHPLSRSQTAGDGPGARRPGCRLPVLFPASHPLPQRAGARCRRLHPGRTGCHHRCAGQPGERRPIRHGEFAAVRTHAGAGRAIHARAVPALSARARPPLGNADRCLQRHERSLGHHVAGFYQQPEPVRRNCLPRQVRWGTPT